MIAAPGSLAAAVLDRCLPAQREAPSCPSTPLGQVEGNRAGPYVQAALDRVIGAVAALPAGARQNPVTREAFGLGVALKRAGLADRETWAGDQLRAAVPWLNTPQYRATVKRCIAAGIAATTEGLPDRDPPGMGRRARRKAHKAIDGWAGAALAYAAHVPGRRRKMFTRVVEAVAILARQHADDGRGADLVEAACRIVALLAGCGPDTAWRYLDQLRAFGLLDLDTPGGLTWLPDGDGVLRPKFPGNVYRLATPTETLSTSDETTGVPAAAVTGGGEIHKASSDVDRVYAALWELRPGGDLDRALRGGGGGTRPETLRAALGLGGAFTLAQLADAAGASVSTMHRHVQDLVKGDDPMLHQVKAGGGRGNQATYAADPAAVLIHAERAAGLEAAAWDRARKERADRVAAVEAARWRGRQVGQDAVIGEAPGAVELVEDCEDSAVGLPDLVEYARRAWGAVATYYPAAAVAT